MIQTRGYYSLIQYCPEPSRLEACNVGVLVFRPEPHFLRAKTSWSSARIRRFFGRDLEIDSQYILRLQQGIEDRLLIEGLAILTPNDLADFGGSLANEIRITTPRPTTIESPEETLETLFRELVLP